LATYLGKYPMCLNSFEFLKYYGSSASVKTSQLVFLKERDIGKKKKKKINKKIN
jgi:hypothetical protein